MEFLNLLASGLGQFLDPDFSFLMLVAMAVGLVFGLIPGLSGLTALAILLPFIYGMEPLAGLGLLLAAHSVINTGGAVTAIMAGIPGAPGCAATVLDGYPMARQGRAGEALGAALAGSGVGGLLGAIALAALLPFLQPVVLLFASPETFFLALMGVAFIAVVGEGPMLKGLLAGALGIFCAFFGYEDVSGVPRFWLGFDYLLDGFRVIPVALGIFAIPELIALAFKGDSIAKLGSSSDVTMAQVWDGCKAVYRHWWVVIKSSLIGVFVGIVPGVGGETSQFVAYAAVKQAAKDPSRFGKGAVEGVLAPESSNNSKEGGALVPTLAFGIPGSVSMALLLGGFLILGLEPGPDFLKEHMDLAVGMSLVVAISNVIGAVAIILVAPWLARVTFVRGHVLAPLLLAVICLGTYSVSNNMTDVAFVFAFGALGFIFKILNYSRAAFLLGFILAAPIETYLHISLVSYGTFFFARPLSLVIIGLLVAGMFWPIVQKRIARTAGVEGAQ